MSNTDLTKIFEKYKYDRSVEYRSKTWFQQQVTLLSKKYITPGQIIGQGLKSANIVPGNLYMFMYDPKYKDELPYYDMFPLVFPYAKTEAGFMGLNLHYLPVYFRVKLLSRLMQFATSKTLDDKTKIKYSWSLISSASKFDIATPCIKQYLLEHVKSPFVKVLPSDWHTAMMLPTERFAKKNKQQIWEMGKQWHR